MCLDGRSRGELVSLVPKRGLLWRRNWTKALRADSEWDPVSAPAPHPSSLPRLRAWSIHLPSFLPVTKPCGGGEGIKSRLASTGRGAGTSLPACPAVCSHRLALALVTPDQWIACYLLDSVLSWLQEGKGSGQSNPEPSLKALLLGQQRTR